MFSRFVLSTKDLLQFEMAQAISDEMRWKVQNLEQQVSKEDDWSSSRHLKLLAKLITKSSFPRHSSQERIYHLDMIGDTFFGSFGYAKNEPIQS